MVTRPRAEASRAAASVCVSTAAGSRADAPNASACEMAPDSPASATIGRPGCAEASRAIASRSSGSPSPASSSTASGSSCAASDAASVIPPPPTVLMPGIPSSIATSPPRANGLGEMISTRSSGIVMVVPKNMTAPRP